MQPSVHTWQPAIYISVTGASKDGDYHMTPPLLSGASPAGGSRLLSFFPSSRGDIQSFRNHTTMKSREVMTIFRLRVDSSGNGNSRRRP